MVGALAATILSLTSAPAQADEVAGTYTRAEVHAAAQWISEHGGRTGAFGTALGFGSIGCGPVAPVCGGLVAYWSATYGIYTDTIATAAKDNACLYVYAGDTASGSDGGGLPYVHEVNDATCRNQ